MALRTGHGNGKGVPRIEVMPIDELPAAIPAKPEQLARREDGTIASSEAAKALGARGGAAKAKKRQQLLGLNLLKLAEDAEFHPYWKVSEQLIQEKLFDLAGQCGGFVGPGPTTFIVTAARQYAASLYLSDLAMKMGGPASAKLFHEASMQSIASRQSMMAAFEMGVKEARARQAADATSATPYAGLLEAAVDAESAD